MGAHGLKSKAQTPDEYLAELPEKRREIISQVRETLLRHLPKGFEEVMGYGMLGYVVPHSLYPSGYHCKPSQPLPFINLASQKDHITVYHMGLYDAKLLKWLQREWEKHSTRKLDMGKCCLRFRKPEDVPLDLLGQLAEKLAPQQWIEIYERNKPNK